MKDLVTVYTVGTGVGISKADGQAERRRLINVSVRQSFILWFRFCMRGYGALQEQNLTNLFFFHGESLFCFSLNRVQQVRSAHFLEHRGQRHGDAGIGAVHGAEPEPA